MPRRTVVAASHRWPSRACTRRRGADRILPRAPRTSWRRLATRRLRRLSAQLDDFAHARRRHRATFTARSSACLAPARRRSASVVASAALAGGLRRPAARPRADAGPLRRTSLRRTRQRLGGRAAVLDGRRPVLLGVDLRALEEQTTRAERSFVLHECRRDGHDRRDARWATAPPCASTTRSSAPVPCPSSRRIASPGWSTDTLQRRSAYPEPGLRCTLVKIFWYEPAAFTAPGMSTLLK